MSPKKPVPQTNRLLAALPRKDRHQLLAGCETVELIFAKVLCEPGDAVRHVYFPTDSYISLVSPVDGHAGLEVALVGNEGMHGLALALGVNSSPLRALVQGDGPAMRMNAATFRRALRHSPALAPLMNRYTYVRMCQIAQAAACTRFHLVEERLARWLLMTQDRAYADELHITHEFLALMLGVRRVGITKAAGSLQKRKLIHYSRGTITVLNRRGLETAACGCYRADKTTYDRVMG
jgi:CRP-like cAMP-binding protein